MLFGKNPIITQTKVSEFAERLKENKIMGTKCKKCGQIYYPPRWACAKCLTEENEWVELSGEGKLATFTTLNVGGTKFEKDIPYTVGIIELKEDQNIKIMGWISNNIDRENLEVGMDLKAVPKTLEDDKITIELIKV